MAESFKRFVQPAEQPARPSLPSPQPPTYAPPHAVNGDLGSGRGAPRPTGPNTQQLASDEELARALQSQYDREEAERQQQQHQRRGQNGAAGRPPDSTGAPRPSPPQPQLLPEPPSGCCAGCRQPLVSLTSMFGGGGRYITALGRSWHPSCFVCAGCRQPLASTGGVQFSVGSQDGLPYHPQCHKQRFHPRCTVCGDFVPTQVGSRWLQAAGVLCAGLRWSALLLHALLAQLARPSRPASYLLGGMPCRAGVR